MRKFLQSVLCSQRSVAFILSAGLCLAAMVMTPASAWAKANNNAYVPNNNGILSVIDTRTNTVIATIPGGFNHPFCATMSPNGKLVYVCSQPNQIKVVDTETNTISASITLPGALGFVGQEGAGPNVAFSRHGERAFVVTSGGGVNSTLYTINTENNTVVSSTSFGRTFLLAVAVAPNGDNIYLAAQAPVLAQSGILVVDTDGDAPTKTIALGHLILDLALSRNGDRLYASDISGLIGGQSGVTVVDTDTNNVVTTVPLSNHSFVTGLALTPDGRHVYACDFTLTNPANSTVTVIDTKDNTVDATIAAPHMTFTAIAAGTRGHKMFAVNSVLLPLTANSTVEVIDTKTNTINDSITVERFPLAIATQPASSRGDDDDRDNHEGDHDH
jgi:YVTN family beta-propeller protein